MKQIPNLLTLLRVVLIPAVIMLLIQETPRSCFGAAVVYVLLAITDALDGWLARRFDVQSLIGKFLDPLADKVLVAALLIYLVWLGWVPPWLACLTLARELAVTSLRALASSEGLVLAALRGGKEKTALQMVALLMLILHFEYVVDFGIVSLRTSFHDVGLGLLLVALFFAITSAAEYVVHVARYEYRKRARAAV